MPPHVELMKGMMAALGLEGQPLKRLVIEIDVMDGAHFYAKGRIKDAGRISSLVRVVEDVTVSPDGVVSVTPVPDEPLADETLKVQREQLKQMRDLADNCRAAQTAALKADPLKGHG